MYLTIPLCSITNSLDGGYQNKKAKFRRKLACSDSPKLGPEHPGNNPH